MTDDAQTVSDRIAIARQARGFKQHEFARALNVHDSQISRWERGLTPRLDALRSIASLTGCSIDWLVTGDGKGPEEAAPLPPAA